MHDRNLISALDGIRTVNRQPSVLRLSYHRSHVHLWTFRRFPFLCITNIHNATFTRVEKAIVFCTIPTVLNGICYEAAWMEVRPCVSTVDTKSHRKHLSWSQKCEFRHTCTCGQNKTGCRYSSKLSTSFIFILKVKHSNGIHLENRTW